MARAPAGPAAPTDTADTIDLRDADEWTGDGQPLRRTRQKNPTAWSPTARAPTPTRPQLDRRIETIRAERPAALKRAGIFITVEALFLAGLCLRQYTDYHFLIAMVGGLVLLAAGVANFALYSELRALRRFAYCVNIGQHFIAGTAMVAVAGYLWSRQFNLVAATWTACFFAVVSLKNPWWFLMESDAELADLARKRNRTSKRNLGDDLQIEPGWDQADGVNDQTEAARERSPQA